MDRGVLRLGQSLEWFIDLAGLVVLFATPTPAGSWPVFEKGMLCAEGPKPEFLRWEDLERFEWHGDIVVVHRSPALIGTQVDSHSLEVPSERRSTREGILATHLRQRP